MLTPQTRQSATSQHRVAAEQSRRSPRSCRSRAIAAIGDRRASEAIGQEAGADRADRPGRDRRERRELGRSGSRRPPAASARSSRRGRRRSTPTSRRAPTCGRGSPDCASRSGTSRQAVATIRGSKRGDGARFRADAGEQDDDRGSPRRSPNARRQRDPPVHAAQRVEEMRRRGAQRERADEDAHHRAPYRPLAHVDGELHADRIDSRHARAGDHAQQRRAARRRDRRPAAARWRRRRSRRTRRTGGADRCGRRARGSAREAAEHEARLHAARQRRLGEASTVRTRRRATGSIADAREPQRHRGDLADAMIETDADLRARSNDVAIAERFLGWFAAEVRSSAA